MKNMKLAFLAGLLAVAFAPLTFAQAVLRPGEVIEIRLAGVPPEEIQGFSAQYTIDDQGNLNLPYINTVKVAGVAPSQAQTVIENKLKSEEIYTHPTITIGMQSSQRFVTVSNAVRNPGRIPYTIDLTLLSAINAAGGLNDYAKQIAYLTRESKRTTYDLKKLRKDPSQDPKMLPGDQIEVPQSWY
jgi:polysaccharide export outer membrane protein